ncbi:MAG: hypothetical protein LBS79_11670 [Tannerella sp.]|jgi:hypothetical protein|nr:hypothetical protein [Tannerella sp.]
MYKALFYKEWIKTKRVIFLSAIILPALIIYTYINTEQMFRLGGHVQTWTNVILKDMSVLPEIAKWFPLFTGLLLALVQYIPEMTDKRMKLTLHLPLPERKIVLSMLLYGTVTLLSAYLLMYLILSMELRFYYTTEIIRSMTWLFLPYFCGGLTAYLLTAWICLEPVWKQRVFNILTGAGGLYLFYIGAKSGAYTTIISYLAVLMVAVFCFPFYSTARFKDGVQK